MAKLKLFQNIGELLTLKGVADKAGRGVEASDLDLKKKQAILSEGGRITWTGPAGKVPARYAKADLEEVDLKGRTVLPAFAECHTHMVFAGDRAEEFELRNQGVSYQEISRRGGGILSTMKKTRKASAEELLGLAKVREIRFAQQGVTTIEVKSGYALDFKNECKMLEVARRLKKTRVRTTYLGAHALPPETPHEADYLKRLVEVDLPKIKKLGLADRVDIFIEKGFFSREAGKTYLQAAKAMGFELCLHADQLSRTKATDLAVELGALSADHAIELSKDDIKKLAASEVVAVLLPAADLYMKCPYPKAREIIDAGGRVALATDFNPGSCPTQDLSLVGLLARLEMKMSLPEVIAGYTYNAASALGLGNDLGSIEVGKFCDLAVLEDSWTSLFYSPGSTPVVNTFREGRKIF